MGDVVSTHPNRRDRGQVEVLAGIGATPLYIANHLGLTEDELRHFYGKELEHGAEEANLKVAQTFFDFATSGDHPQMTLLWMKMRAKWSEAPIAQTDDEDTEAVLEEARAKLTKLLNRGT